LTAVAAISIPVGALVLLTLIFIAWRRHLWASEKEPWADSCPYSLMDEFGDHHFANVPHQRGVKWLSEIFSRSARKYPKLTALQIPHTGESLSYAELDERAGRVAAALSPLLTGPDQVVAVAMPQDNWQIVAAHLGILRAGGVVMFLDPSLPRAVIEHMLDDVRPVVVLTRGQAGFGKLPSIDVLELPEEAPAASPPGWLDDPEQRLATIFYTSGTTGKPKGVECPHAGYVNLALSYADYYDLVPGMDATTLTSSMAYDGSISEMYSAWVSGCAVVLLTREQVRSGPDLVPILREAEVTMLFCPPVLLSTLTPNPELDLPYPLCRYIVPAGEAFPATLVEPWTRGRRQIINTYGPTEASTDTSRQSLRPGEPVTIGPPFANVRYVILDPGGLDPLPHGDTGELCIGGVHLARAYRNLPGETARKFIKHPRFGRLYRTGDRCRIDIAKQSVHFLGRLDSQLKVRGHRVETQAVEDILQAQFEEIEAAVLDYQNGELVAFVASPSLLTASDAAEPAPVNWAERVTAALGAQLPQPSVPARIFLVETFAMNPVSGKIDREALPRVSELLLQAGNGRGASQAAPEEGVISVPLDADSSEADAAGVEYDAEALDICRSVFETPIGWDDVFADHGGHSIVIAQLAQRLQAAGWVVPVRALLSDCNTARKVALLPRSDAPVVDSCRAVEANRLGSSRPDSGRARVLSVGLFTTLQVLFLAVLYGPALAGFVWLLSTAEVGEFFMTAPLGHFVLAGLYSYLAALVFPFASLLWVMMLKTLLGGHPYQNGVEPGTYPKWSRMHLRVWCIERMERTVLRPLSMLFRSAPLTAYALRRLGAKVGRNLQCAQNVAFSGPLDLLSIGDDVAIQTGAYIQPSRWQEGHLLIGPVQLGSGCKIAVRAAVTHDVSIGRGATIHPFTPVMRDVGPHEMWEGAPARFEGRCTELKRTADALASRFPPWLLETGNILMQLCLEFCLMILPTAMISWIATTLLPARDTELAGEFFTSASLSEVVLHMGWYTFITSWLCIVVVSVLLCLFLRLTSFTPGLYSPRGLKGSLLLYRLKKMNQLQRVWTWTVSGQYLRALAGMRFPRLGASECDLMFNLVPELTHADSQVFWSNGCFTNMLDYGAEQMTLRSFDMPANFFAGNNSVAESGYFPSNFMLGVSTPASDLRFRRQMRSRPGEPVTAAGNPPVVFASADFEAENAQHQAPGFLLYLARVLLNDVFSIGALPIAGFLCYVVVFTGMLRAQADPLLSALLALLLTEFVLVALCVTVKKLLVGSQWGTGHSTPFWSWRHFSYFFAQDCFFTWCRAPLDMFAGTVLSNPMLRWMGCKVGKRTIVASPMQTSDWNAVQFGNDCVINGFLQFHTFENMILKVKRTEISDGCTVDFGATVMGGVVMGPATSLSPLSLVLKEMRLPTASYEGSPVETVVEDQ
jgi:non-ribosomal peptide synthetase-like protein